MPITRTDLNRAVNELNDALRPGRDLRVSDEELYFPGSIILQAATAGGYELFERTAVGNGHSAPKDQPTRRLTAPLPGPATLAYLQGRLDQFTFGVRHASLSAPAAVLGLDSPSGAGEDAVETSRG